MTVLTQLKREQTASRVDGYKAKVAARVHLQCRHCGHEVAYSPLYEQCGVCGWEWLNGSILSALPAIGPQPAYADLEV
jgi:ribosomal protein L37E